MKAVRAKHFPHPTTVYRYVLVAVLFLFTSFSNPDIAIAATAYAEGDSATINGYVITTNSSAYTYPNRFTTNSYVWSSIQASPGSLRALNRMQVGPYTPYYFSITSSWAYNKSANVTVGATNQYSFTSNPGWGLIQSNGTGGIYINGWQDLNAGTAVAPLEGSRSSLAMLKSRATEYIDPDSGEVYLRVIGENGRRGYVKKGEESFLDYMSPQEAISFIENSCGEMHISVYDDDLETVIDSYLVTFSLV